MEHDTWEYATDLVLPRDEDYVLADRGREGWELADTMEWGDSGKTKFYFKRKKSNLLTEGV